MKPESIGKTPYRIFNMLTRPLRKDPKKDDLTQIHNESVDMLRKLKGPKVLEIGSRNVSNVTRKDLFPNASKYVGFDVLDGENVDVVGDAHQLSEYVAENSFDIVYSVSVFEHLMFPWKAALEIN